MLLNSIKTRYVRCGVLLSICCIFNCGLINREQPVASVEGETLSKAELEMNFAKNENGTYNEESLRQYVNEWIDQELLFQEANRQNIKVTPFMTYELERIKKSMLVNLFLKERIDNIISVSDQEIEAYYDEHKSEFLAHFNYYKFEGIKTTDRSFASKLANEIVAEGNVVKVYEKYPDKCNVISFGRRFIVESIIPEKLLPAVATALRTGFKRSNIDREVYFIKLIEVQKKNETKNLELVRDEIEQMLLFRKRQDKYKDLVSRLRTNNNFDLNLDVLTDSTSAR